VRFLWSLEFSERVISSLSGRIRNNRHNATLNPHVNTQFQRQLGSQDTSLVGPGNQGGTVSPEVMVRISLKCVKKQACPFGKKGVATKSSQGYMQARSMENRTGGRPKDEERKEKHPKIGKKKTKEMSMCESHPCPPILPCRPSCLSSMFLHVEIRNAISCVRPSFCWDRFVPPGARQVQC